jgi:DNA-binding cell septation regulator SpoVG
LRNFREGEKGKTTGGGRANDIRGLGDQEGSPMEITDVRIRLIEDKTERLRAFCTMTLDREFVVRDIKIIDGAKGLFVAMPSRKLADHCLKCHSKNHLRAKFCNECGARLPGKRAPDPTEASGKLHVDVAHPINSECRARFQKVLLDAFHAEVEKAKTPGYVPPDLHEPEEEAHHPKPGPGQPPAAQVSAEPQT